MTKKKLLVLGLLASVSCKDTSHQDRTLVQDSELQVGKRAVRGQVASDQNVLPATAIGSRVELAIRGIQPVTNEPKVSFRIVGSDYASYRFYYDMLANDQEDCIKEGFAEAKIPLEQETEVGLGQTGTYRICIEAYPIEESADPTLVEQSFLYEFLPTAQLIEAVPILNNYNSLSLSVTGEGVSSYQYALTDDPECLVGVVYSEKKPVNEPLLFETGADGVKVLCLKGITAAGSIQSSPTVTSWMKDTVSPIALVGIEQLPRPINNLTNLQLTIVGDKVDQYQYFYGPDTGGCQGVSYSEFVDKVSTPDISLSGLGTDGGKILCIRGKSSAGNEQINPTEIRWVKDTIPPSPVLQNRPMNPSNEDQVSILVAGDKVDFYRFVYLEGQNQSVCANADYGEEFASTSPISLNLGNDGLKVLCVRARSEAGNVADVSYAWTKDTMAPNLRSQDFNGLPANPSATDSFEVRLANQSLGVTTLDFAVLSGGSCAGAVYRPAQPSSLPISFSLAQLGLGQNGLKSLCIRGYDEAMNTTRTVRHTWEKAPIINFANQAALPQNGHDWCVENVRLSIQGANQYYFFVGDVSSPSDRNGMTPCPSSTLAYNTEVSPYAAGMPINSDIDGFDNQKVLCVVPSLDRIHRPTFHTWRQLDGSDGDCREDLGLVFEYRCLSPVSSISTNVVPVNIDPNLGELLAQESFLENQIAAQSCNQVEIKAYYSGVIGNDAIIADTFSFNVTLSAPENMSYVLNFSLNSSSTSSNKVTRSMGAPSVNPISRVNVEEL